MGKGGPGKKGRLRSFPLLSSGRKRKQKKYGGELLEQRLKKKNFGWRENIQLKSKSHRKKKKFA